MDELMLILASCLSLKVASDRVSGNHAFRVIVRAPPQRRWRLVRNHAKRMTPSRPVGRQASATMLEADPSANPAPSPDAVLPALDADQQRALRDVGSEWSQGANGSNVSLPVDPSLGHESQPSEPTRSGRFVHIDPTGGSPDQLEVTLGDDGADRGPRTVGRRIRRAVLGPPLKSTAIVQERMRKLIALPVLSADALSSVAYGPEAMLAVLVLAGGPGLGWSLPVSGAIAFLMLAVGLSYRQTIRAYPHGGGSYIVASANLGRTPGLVAAAGLITDYVLTVAVSISSGLAAVTSAVPSLQPAVVPIGVALIGLLLTANLRGVRQAGALFAAPTYAFIVAIALLLIVALLHAGQRGFTRCRLPFFMPPRASACCSCCVPSRPARPR
jgi:Amino acid permease